MDTTALNITMIKSPRRVITVYIGPAREHWVKLTRMKARLGGLVLATGQYRVLIP